MNNQKRLAELDWLKSLALLLLVFVHSILYFSFPSIIYPVEWFMLSTFFFISGFLTFNSFKRRGLSIRGFFKSKFKSIYLPFLVGAILFFVIGTATGMTNADPLSLVFHGLSLNIFNRFNSGVYNLDYLWFIPLLLVFMLIACLLEQHFKNVKVQVITISAMWLLSLLAWVYNSPLKLDWNFSQYFLVFMIGFWLSKSGKYESVLKPKMALVIAPIFAFFSLNLSNLFAFSSALETTKYLLYFHGRSILLSLSAILLVLILLKKLKAPHNQFIKMVAETSLFIYLLEPLLSTALGYWVFSSSMLYSVNGLAFYPYQIMRISFLFFLIPILAKSFRQGLISPLPP